MAPNGFRGAFCLNYFGDRRTYGVGVDGWESRLNAGGNDGGSGSNNGRR